MDIAIGKEGTEEACSFQDPFPEETKCCKCKGKAQIAFVASESNEKIDICDLHETTGKKGGLWLHDSCAVAVYFCRDCLEPTALANQG